VPVSFFVSGLVGTLGRLLFYFLDPSRNPPSPGSSCCRVCISCRYLRHGCGCCSKKLPIASRDGMLNRLVKNIEFEVFHLFILVVFLIATLRNNNGQFTLNKRITLYFRKANYNQQHEMLLSLRSNRFSSICQSPDASNI